MTPQSAQLLRIVCWILLKGFGLALIVSAWKGIWERGISTRWHSLARFETLSTYEKNRIPFWFVTFLWLMVGGFLLFTPVQAIIPGLR